MAESITPKPLQFAMQIEQIVFFKDVIGSVPIAT